MNKSFTIFALLLIMISLVNASSLIVNIPDSINSFEEFQQSISRANGDSEFLSVASESYWGYCQNTCFSLLHFGDCNPCKSGEVANDRMWFGDSISDLSPYVSAYYYCNTFPRQYDYYNQQAYCKAPTIECSGGYEPGEKKCDGDDVWYCRSSGTWGLSDSCEVGCSNAVCEEETCESNVDRKCYGNSVYWYDSCGDRGNEYERCDSDEECQRDRCVKTYSEGFIGEKLCSGLNVVQQYLNQDGSTDIRTVETCDYGCQYSQCLEPECPTLPLPTAWSQCQDSKMSRTNYKCGSSTSFNSVPFTEEESCECGVDSQCQYNEACEGSICEPVECAEDEIADNHECVKVSSISNTAIILIVFGVVLFIIILILVTMVLRSKGGRSKK